MVEGERNGCAECHVDHQSLRYWLTHQNFDSYSRSIHFILLYNILSYTQAREKIEEVMFAVNFSYSHLADGYIFNAQLDYSNKGFR